MLSWFGSGTKEIILTMILGGIWHSGETKELCVRRMVGRGDAWWVGYKYHNEVTSSSSIRHRGVTVLRLPVMRHELPVPVAQVLCLRVDDNGCELYICRGRVGGVPQAASVKLNLRKPAPAMRERMMLRRPIFSLQARCCSGVRIPDLSYKDGLWKRSPHRFSTTS